MRANSAASLTQWSYDSCCQNGSPVRPSNKVSLTSRIPLERLQQPARRHLRQQEHVDVVCHDSECSELIVTKFHAVEKRVDHQMGDRLLPQEHGAGASKVQVPIDPD